MTPLNVGLIGIVILLALIFTRMPIAFVMALVGFAGFAYLRGLNPALALLGSVPYRTFANYDLCAAPLFILMGYLCFFAGISTDLYDTVHRWIGHLRGGLAMATVCACAAFAAISGSSMATAVTMGTVALPEMKRYKYDPALATGVIAAGGTIGVLIPPSIGLILYGVITEQSIGRLFLAGFIPGVLEAVFYIITIFILCRWNPSLGPPGPRTSLTEKVKSLQKTWIVLALFLLVIGGIYFGVFSPTEAGGVGAFGAFLFAVGKRRLNWQTFQSSILDTVKIGAMCITILAGATILTDFMAVSRLPSELGFIISGLPVSRYIIIVVILFFYLMLGCFMDPISMILLTMPIFFPLILALDFNPIWFGILVTRMGEMGCITPPVGINVFIIKGVAKDVPMYTIFRGIIPFLIADICHVALLVAVPSLALFLPNLMK